MRLRDAMRAAAAGERQATAGFGLTEDDHELLGAVVVDVMADDDGVVVAGSLVAEVENDRSLVDELAADGDGPLDGPLDDPLDVSGDVSGDGDDDLGWGAHVDDDVQVGDDADTPDDDDGVHHVDGLGAESTHHGIDIGAGPDHRLDHETFGVDDGIDHGLADPEDEIEGHASWHWTDDDHHHDVDPDLGPELD